MEGKFRPASRNEYIAWLDGYIRNGGKPTHYHDYPFERVQRFFVYVTGRFGIDGESGVSARSIIVAPGGELDPRLSQMGHNQLFYMDGFVHRYNTAPIIPIYSDDDFFKLPGVPDFITLKVNSTTSVSSRRPYRGTQR